MSNLEKRMVEVVGVIVGANNYLLSAIDRTRRPRRIKPCSLYRQESVVRVCTSGLERGHACYRNTTAWLFVAT